MRQPKVTVTQQPQSAGLPAPGLPAPLEELAALYGVQTCYRGSAGGEVRSPAESTVSALRSLGADLPGGPGSVPADAALKRAVSARCREMSERMMEPVLIAWEGELPSVTIRSPRAAAGAAPRLTMTTEDGETSQWSVAAADLRPARSTASGGAASGCGGGLASEVPTPWRGARRLPWGYHRLRVDWGRCSAEAQVISAPRRCWSDAEGASTGRWGLFAPLYALRSDRDWGAGDLAELRALAEWTAGCGGSAVATLPLLAAYLDAPFEPSPYRPVSRLFWNEFYLALERLPEWEGCPVARELASRPELSMVRTELRRMDLVDYRGAIALKRAILEPMVRCFFDGGDDARKDSFALWLVANPEASQYAAFRARVDELRVDWLAWSRSEGEAVPRPDSPEERYHLYCQWQMAEQLGALARDAAAGAAAGLFLDLPVGVHSGGFDTWRRPQLFVHDMSAGAPPDAFFELGQYWDSPPLHPERARQDGHRYFATCLRQHMRFASFLRIDHVMSLHRLFWVPFGSGPSAGVYVRYPAEELYAVLSLESHRNQTVVVGEDLGTVPPEVRPAMRRHGVLRTWVAQTSFRPRSSDPVATPPPGCVAGINTHDMFPFAGFVEGADIGARLQTGQVDEAGARREAAARARLVTRLETWAARNTAGPGPGGSTRRAAAVSEGSADPGRPAVAGPPLGPGAHVLLGPLISRLLASDAALTLVALEDLHGETRPQNMPGMGDERGNWRRKAAGIGQQ